MSITIREMCQINGKRAFPGTKSLRMIFQAAAAEPGHRGGCHNNAKGEKCSNQKGFRASTKYEI
jgi:hypothetical protein